MVDPIADMLTRIRNASRVKKEVVVLPLSKIKYNIAKILERDGWIKSVEVIKINSRKNSTMAFDELKLTLHYENDGKPTITSLKRISKPGRRIYTSKEKLPKVLNNLGVAIISTSHGLMTNKEAVKQNIGGEIICEIY